MFKSYVDFKDWQDYVYFLYSHGTFTCLWLLRLVCSCKYNYVVVTQIIAAYHLFYGLFMPNYNRIFHIIQIICTMPNHSNKIFSKWFCINYFLIFCTYLGKLVKSIYEHNWNWEDHAPVFDMSLWGINYGRLRLLFICIYIKTNLWYDTLWFLTICIAFSALFLCFKRYTMLQNWEFVMSHELLWKINFCKICPPN